MNQWQNECQAKIPHKSNSINKIIAKNNFITSTKYKLAFMASRKVCTISKLQRL